MCAATDKVGIEGRLVGMDIAKTADKSDMI